MNRLNSALLSTTLMVAAAGLSSSSAFATDGMLPHGVGARNSALAGAGVADQNDATATAVNPAGLVNSDTQLNISASLFSPHRAANIIATGAGEVESDSNYFVIPSAFYSYRLDANRAIGVGMYAAGGMNTDYPAVFPGNTNMFGGTGRLGIDLQQIIMSVAYAQRFGNISIGIAPTFGIQFFDADGLPGGYSSQDNSAAGIALRGGVEWDVRPGFRLGLAGSTPGYVQAFSSYRNAFIEGDGAIQQPAYLQAGAAVDLMPNLTLMADYKRIFYAGSPAIGDDFGWSDINVYKVGMEWDLNPGFTLRAGYSYNDNPLPSMDSTGVATFPGYFANTLAPATVQHHITGGARMNVRKDWDLEVAGMYAPEQEISGAAGSVKMYQWQATAGVVWHLGSAEAPLK